MHRQMRLAPTRPSINHGVVLEYDVNKEIWPPKQKKKNTTHHLVFPGQIRGHRGLLAIGWPRVILADEESLGWRR